MQYYDLSRHWTKKIVPHLDDQELNKILVRDFNKFTFGRWRERFRRGQHPRDFESCDWWLDRRREEARFWMYTKHSACHWLVNFNLRLANLAQPRRSWRIITSDRYSAVWDGKSTLFEFNCLAFGLPPNECFDLANKRELPLGKSLRVWYADHCSKDPEPSPLESAPLVA